MIYILCIEHYLKNVLETSSNKNDFIDMSEKDDIANVDYADKNPDLQTYLFASLIMILG